MPEAILFGDVRIADGVSAGALASEFVLSGIAIIAVMIWRRAIIEEVLSCNET
jgi:hypothetical protein